MGGLTVRVVPSIHRPSEAVRFCGRFLFIQLLVLIAGIKKSKNLPAGFLIFLAIKRKVTILTLILTSILI